MTSFRQKKISRGKTLADKLKQTRLEKDISLKDAEEATQIQVKYLEILEEGDYQKLPGNIYAKAWLKLYGQFLGLDTSELLVDYKIEKSVSDKLTKITSIKKVNYLARYSILKPTFLKGIAIAVLVLALLGYLAWEVNNTIAPPAVTIFKPQNNFKTTENSIIIQGRTQTEVTLNINNQLVPLDQEGKFSQVINLVDGLNNLQISAKKKHSKTNNLEWIILRVSLE